MKKYKTLKGAMRQVERLTNNGSVVKISRMDGIWRVK